MTLNSAAPCEATPMDAENIFPVVQLPESHTILSSLLTFVFPVPYVLPETIEQILELLSVAQKYEMDTTLTLIRACVSRRNPTSTCPGIICSKTALHVYSLAWNHDLVEEMVLAARETLKAPMTIDTYEDKLNSISIPALCELWNFRKQVRHNLSSGFYKDVSKSELFLSLTDLGCVETSKPCKIPLWLHNYLRSVPEDPACFDPITFYSALSSHVSSGDCKQCCSISSKTIREFWIVMKASVHESVRKVGLILTATCGRSHLAYRLIRCSFGLRSLKKRAVKVPSM